MRAWLGRPEAGLFALVLVCCGWFYQAGGWNQNSRFDLTRAIVEDGTSRIDRFHKNTGDEAKRGKHYYCDKAPGLSWMAVPPYALARAVARPGAKASPTFLAWSAWWSTVIAVGLPSAIAAVMFAQLLLALGLRAGPACGGAAAWSLATLAWPYGTLMYGHQIIASLLLIGFALVAIPRLRGVAASPRRLAIAGLVLGWAVVVEYPAALGCVAIGLYAIRAHGWRRALWLVAGAVPPAIALATYHAIVFGGPTTLPYEFSTQKHRSMGFFMGLGAPDPTALWHILFSDFRGLFYATPWLLLAVPGGVMWWRAGRRAEVIVCAAIVVLFVWLNASLVDWQGGWAMGARYLVPCLPFLALLACGVLTWRPARGPRIAALVIGGALLSYSAGNMLVGTAVKPEVDIAIKQPYGDFLYPRFARGELAVSTQSIDMKGAPRRGPRQAWNLGDRVGLDGRASLVPLALISIGCALWITRRARVVDITRGAM